MCSVQGALLRPSRAPFLLGVCSSQVFNEFNARSIGNKMWVFYDLLKNPIFGIIIIITVGLQIFIVEVGGKFTSTTGLTLKHWGWSILLACFTTPLGVLMRLIPVKESKKAFANFYSNHEVRSFFLSLLCWFAHSWVSAPFFFSLHCVFCMDFRVLFCRLLVFVFTPSTLIRVKAQPQVFEGLASLSRLMLMRSPSPRSHPLTVW